MQARTVGWLLLLCAAPVTAQEPLRLARISSPVVIDGKPDEPAWQSIDPLPTTMYTPIFRGAPTQRTEIRVGYDDEYFYAAGWFYDTDPRGIRINSLYRDRWNGDDAMAIYLDVFNDNRNAKWFGITPAGMRFDQLVSDDGATLNGSWDTFWDGKTTVTEQGWFVEVRIPFSSLGFQASGGDAVMGLTITRYIARLNERVTFPEIDPRYEFRAPSVARDVVLSGVRAAKPLYVTPYALSGLQQRVGLERALQRELGGDLRYPITSELTLDLTANTDFAQVEADDQQVNLERFSLFFPEKRRFFQERSEIFDFGMGMSGGRLFHSRQIGLLPDQRVPVLGGARLVGRLGAWDIGLLDLQTRAAGALPGENFAVARLKRGVLNPYSSAGALLTSRVSDQNSNIAYGLDGTFRMFGNDYLWLRWAQTFDSRDSGSIGAFDRSQYYLQWERRSTRGLQFAASTTRSGHAYRPELGFLPRRDFTTANLIGNYFIYTDGHKFFRRIIPGALVFNTFRNSDGALESGTYAFWVQWDTKAGGSGWLEPKWFREDVLTPFRIGDRITIPAGIYDFMDFQVVWQMPPGRKVRTNLDARAGTYFDGRRQQVIVNPTWNVSRNLELGADYQLSRLQFDARDQADNIHVLRMRVRGALNAQASGNAFVQYNSTTDRVALNFRLRYNFAEGTDLWLVYDETLNTEQPKVAGIRSPLSAARALVLKYSHTFQF